MWLNERMSCAGGHGRHARIDFAVTCGRRLQSSTAVPAEWFGKEF